VLILVESFCRQARAKIEVAVLEERKTLMFAEVLEVSSLIMRHFPTKKYEDIGRQRSSESFCPAVRECCQSLHAALSHQSI